jgi:hypothetical protein
VVSSIEPVDGVSGDTTREELQADVMRFADRFSAQLVQIAEQIRYADDGSVRRVDALIFQYAAQAAPLDVAMGRNPVTNLMDMMVMTTLARHTAADYWTAEVDDPEQAQVLLETVARLERDIWAVSGKVLTDDQQVGMRQLIEAWREEHPGVRNIWRIRFSAFSGQRAAELREVQRTGGLMGQLSRSVDAVEEMQEYGERLLHYLQRAPELARLQGEWAVYEVLDQPEIQAVIRDSDRLALVAEQLAALAERLPGEQFAAVDQVMDRLSSERTQLFEDILAEEPRIRATIGDLTELLGLVSVISANVKETTESFERTAAALNLDLTPTGSEPVNIQDYIALVRESAGAAVEVRRIVDAVDGRAVDQELDQLLDRAFIYVLISITVFFVALFGYRMARRRFID